MTGDRQDAVDQLKRLVEDEPGLYLGSPMDERTLQVHLYWANYDVKKAFERMKQIFKHKLQHSEFYAHRRVRELHDAILKKGIHTLLENRDQLGRRIYLIRLGKMVYGAHEPHEMFQIDDLWLSLALDEEETQKNGMVIVADMGGMSWKFLRYFIPSIVKVGATKAENIPLRSIQYHVINAGMFVNTIIQLIFPFLDEATKKQVFFHKNMESLYAHIAPNDLPADYGGKQPPIDADARVTEYLDTKDTRLTQILSYGYTSKT